MCSVRPLLAAMLIGLSGCAESQPGMPAMDRAATKQSEPGMAANVQFAAMAPTSPQPAAGAGAAAGAGQAADIIPAPDPGRKIIYNASLDLVVDEFAASSEAVTRLAAMHQAYVADLEISGTSENIRRGQWKVRVPVDQFEPFLAAILELGVATKNHRDSQDVSDRYYDTQARIKNKKVEEARLVKLLEEVGGKLEEILVVEKELSRVRGEIEGLEGTVRVLSNLTSLTTVTISMLERKPPVTPPVAAAPPAPPTFVEMISRTFHESLDLLVGFGKSAILFFVAISVWLPIILLVAVLFFRLVPRRRADVRTTPR